MTGGERRLAERLVAQQCVEVLVQRLIATVDRKQIPSGKYQTVLINEGHDFAPECLRLVTQLVELLLVNDNAENIYKRARSKQFSFKSVGVQARGRISEKILQTANLIADDLLTADDKDDDGIPLLKPINCGREGQAPIIIKLPSLREEAFAIGDQLSNAHSEGHAWGDMAILCEDWKTMDLCADALHQRKLLFNVRKRTGEYNPAANTIQIMTMKVSKGLEFPVVALPGLGHMPALDEDEQETARVFFVAATRATHKLVIGVGGDEGFGKRLRS